MGEYIKAVSMSFAFSCWNADSGATGGVLQDDWKTVNDDKMTVLTPPHLALGRAVDPRLGAARVASD